MLLPPIHQLSLVGVFDAGIPNMERVVLRPTQQLNLGEFGLFTGIKASNGLVTPIRDHFFWLGETWITPPAWIFVYTGTGAPRWTTMPNSGDAALVLHWGRATTMFNVPSIVPVVFRLGAIVAG